MALTDVAAKRDVMIQAIADYKTALLGGDPTAIETARVAAQTAGDDYAKEVTTTNIADPSILDADFFTNPALMSLAKRSDIATIMRLGVLKTGQTRIQIQTDRKTAGAKVANLPFLAGTNATVYWGDGSPGQTATGSTSHIYDTPGTYVISIEGTVNGFSQPISEYNQLFVDVLEWGNVQYNSMESMFYGRTGFTFSATDAPILAAGCSLANTFRGAVDFNSPIGHWNTSGVTNMYATFWGAASFNQDITTWDTSSVTRMEYMFREANSFNQPIGTWSVGNVTKMFNMFYGADNFNQNLSSWNVIQVTDYSTAWAHNTPLQASYYPNFP